MTKERITIANNEAFLRQISKEVDFNDKSYLDDIKQLAEYCRDNVVFAMAPVQIGIPKRIIYLKNTTGDMSKNYDSNYDEAKVLINPVIVERKGHTRFLEGCESCLDYRGFVDRPFIVIVEYYDINGNKMKESFKSFEATVFSHEYDHLNGVLHIDLAEEIIELTLDGVREYRKNHPYKVISEDCNYDLISKKSVNEYTVLTKK